MLKSFAFFVFNFIFFNELRAETNTFKKYWIHNAPSIFQSEKPLDNQIVKDILSLNNGNEKIEYALNLIALHSEEDEDIYEMEDLDNALWIRVKMQERIPIIEAIYESLTPKEKNDFAEKLLNFNYQLIGLSNFTVYLKEDLADTEWIRFFTKVIAGHVYFDDEAIFKLRSLPLNYLNQPLLEKILKETCGSLNMAILLEEIFYQSTLLNDTDLEVFFDYLTTLSDRDRESVNYSRIYRKSLLSKTISKAYINKLKQLVESSDQDTAQYLRLLYEETLQKNNHKPLAILKEHLIKILNSNDIRIQSLLSTLSIINQAPDLIPHKQKAEFLKKIIRHPELEKEKLGGLIHLHLLGIIFQSKEEFRGELGPDGYTYKIFTHPQLKKNDFYLVYTFIEKAKRSLKLEDNDSVLSQSALYALSKDHSNTGLTRAIECYILCPYPLNKSDYLFQQAIKQLDLSNPETTAKIFTLLNKYPELQTSPEGIDFIRTRSPAQKKNAQTLYKVRNLKLW